MVVIAPDHLADNRSLGSFFIFLSIPSWSLLEQINHFCLVWLSTPEKRQASTLEALLTLEGEVIHHTSILDATSFTRASAEVHHPNSNTGRTVAAQSAWEL